MNDPMLKYTEDEINKSDEKIELAGPSYEKSTASISTVHIDSLSRIEPNLTTERTAQTETLAEGLREVCQEKEDLRMYTMCYEQIEIDQIANKVCDLLENTATTPLVERLLQKRSSMIANIVKRKREDTEKTSFARQLPHSSDDMRISRTPGASSLWPPKQHYSDDLRHPIVLDDDLLPRKAMEQPVQRDTYNYIDSVGSFRRESRHIQENRSKPQDINIDDIISLDEEDEEEQKNSSSTEEEAKQGPRDYFAEKFKEKVAKPLKFLDEVSSSLPCSENALTEDQWRAFACLKKVFKLSSFRHNQLEIITQALLGKDLFVLMPTGGGKSLTFQLPAIMADGITVVVSPLLALIQDQIKNLIKKGIPAIAINSSLTKTEKALALQILTSTGETICSSKYRGVSVPLVKIVYVTPELLVISSTFNRILQMLLEKKKLARFIIDEAHCVSQWGHDFRPDYTQLSVLKKNYPSVPITALTATATPSVQKDVVSGLGLEKCIVFSQSFNRPNIRYTVKPKMANPIPDIVSFIQEYYVEDSGIIYCFSKKDCEWLSEKLNREYHMKTGYYHAGLSKKERQDIAYKWDTMQIQIVVATIAFGMGIDKKDVRFVIHYSIPKSLEGYYQETGRAGRDQLESECVLFYSYIDKKKLDFMIDRGEASLEAKNRQKDLLRRVISFCENKAECRRALILDYFGEKFSGDCNQGCDNCRNRKDIKQIDCLAEALAIKRIVSKVAQITESTLVKECKAVSSKSKDIITRVVRWMVGQGYLRTKLVIGDRGFSWSYLTEGQGRPTKALISIHPDEITNTAKKPRVARTTPIHESISLNEGSKEYLDEFLRYS